MNQISVGDFPCPDCGQFHSDVRCYRYINPFTPVPVTNYLPKPLTEADIRRIIREELERARSTSA